MGEGRMSAVLILNANALSIPLRDESVHAVVTSPPYYALRDYKTDGQLGLEKRADCLGWATGHPCGECYICQMVAVFREVKRVLRKDGVCFLNCGDSYAGSNAMTVNEKALKGKQGTNKGTHGVIDARDYGSLKPKDMMLIPQRLALALQADGWWIRSDIIWAKPNPMPESVTDRPTKSHEYIWLLAKSRDYFWDQEAVREADHPDGRKQTIRKGTNRYDEDLLNKMGDNEHERWSGSRNLRTVWSIATQPYSGAHYATYPEELVLRCLKAATSERGCCPKCGKQWEREVEKSGVHRERNLKINTDKALMGINEAHRLNGKDYIHATVSTNNFRPACSCDLPSVPATILDPFAGSGTTLLVAKRMGLNAIGLDLSYQYLRENAWERVNMQQGVLI
jgi:DNA modification methylase